MIMEFVDWFLELVFLKVFPVLLTAGIIFGVPIGAYAIYTYSGKPTFELKKDEWSCTKVHERTTSHMVMVGKVMVPQSTTSNVCVEWSRQ